MEYIYDYCYIIRFIWRRCANLNCWQKQRRYILLSAFFLFRNVYFGNLDVFGSQKGIFQRFLLLAWHLVHRVDHFRHRLDKLVLFLAIQRNSRSSVSKVYIYYKTKRAGRASKIGTRAGRIIRIVRLVRLVKLYKVSEQKLLEEA